MLRLVDSEQDAEDIVQEAWIRAAEAAAGFQWESGFGTWLTGIAINRLPVGYRTVLVLHDLEGFRHEEIAEQLGIALGTSKSQLFHARRCVRALLEPSEVA